jgi:MarR family
MPMTLDDQAGAALREKLNKSASDRLNLDQERREEFEAASSIRAVEHIARANEVATQAQAIHAKLEILGEMRTTQAVERASDRAHENNQRKASVQEILAAQGAKRVSNARRDASKRVSERETLSAETGQLLEAHATARAVMREQLEGFARQLRGSDIKPVVRATRPGQPAAKPQGALSVGVAVLNPVEKRREHIVLRTITSVPGLSLEDLAQGLKLDQSEVSAMLKRLVAGGKIRLSDNGYVSSDA